MEEMSKTAQDTVALIESFLEPVRAQAEKEAETVSFKDTAEATLPNQEKQTADEGKPKQTDLGVEQSQDAKDSGSTTDSTPENKDSDADKVPDDQGPKTLDSDETVKGKGNIGPMRSQEITQEQKSARFETLANALLKTAEDFLKAAEEAPAEPEVKPEGEAEKTAEAPVQETDAKPEPKPEGEVEKTAEELVVEACADTSLEAAREYFEAHLHGMLKRAQDTAELENVDFGKLGISKEKLEQLGGIAGLLDKTALGDPAAVMPEELLGALPGAGAPAPAEAPALPGVLPGPEAGLGAPAPEAGLGAGPEAGGDVSEEELAALTNALAEAGVSPEDIDQATQDVMDLFQAGVSPEEAAQAIGELVEESIGGEGAAEAAPEEAMGEGAPAPAPAPEAAPAPAPEAPVPAPEAPAEEASPKKEEPEKEAEGEKTAEDKEARARVDAIKEQLRSSRTK